MIREIILAGLIVSGFAFLIAGVGINVHAQALDGLDGVQEGLNSGLDKANALKDSAEGFTEKDRAEFLAQQWKEALLKNSVINTIDSLFKKLNWVFIVLFGRSYALSIELFFSMLLWSLCLAFVHLLFHLKKEWLNWVLGIGISMGLAQLQIFNYIASFASKFVLEASGTWWTLARTAVIILFVVFLFVLNKYFGKEIGAMRKARELHETKHRLEVLEEREKHIDKALEQDPDGLP